MRVVRGLLRRRSSIRPKSKPGRGRLDWLAKAQHAFDPGFALIDLVAARHEKRVEIRTTEDDVRQPFVLRLGDDAVDAPGLVAELESQLGSHVEAALRVVGHAVGRALRAAVREMEVKVSLFVGKTAVGLNLEGIDKLALRVVHD